MDVFLASFLQFLLNKLAYNSGLYKNYGSTIHNIFTYYHCKYFCKKLTIDKKKYIYGMLEYYLNRIDNIPIKENIEKKYRKNIIYNIVILLDTFDNL